MKIPAAVYLFIYSKSVNAAFRSLGPAYRSGQPETCLVIPGRCSYDVTFPSGADIRSLYPGTCARGSSLLRGLGAVGVRRGFICSLTAQEWGLQTGAHR